MRETHHLDSTFQPPNGAFHAPYLTAEYQYAEVVGQLAGGFYVPAAECVSRALHDCGNQSYERTRMSILVS